MIETRTDFALLGDRDYINGATLLSGFIDALEKAGVGRVTINRLKFQKIAGTNGRLVIDTHAIPGADAANCVLTAQGEGVTWRGAFFEEGRAAQRRAAPECSVKNLSAQDFAGECDIAPDSRDALIYDVVQANKRIHEATLGAAARPVVRFGYVEGWTAPPADVAFEARLRAANLIRKKTAGGYLTVNRISYAPPGGAPATSMLLCFEVTAQDAVKS